MESGSGLRQTVALVGLMGSGKSAVGHALAARLGVPFVDGDSLVEERTGCTVPEIFSAMGEKAFRSLEAEVTRGVLEGPPQVMALGGGAFMNPETRASIGERAVSVWLRAALDTLMERCGDGEGRPLLREDPRSVLESLIELRYPIYAEADLAVDTDGLAVEQVVELAELALRGQGALQ